MPSTERSAEIFATATSLFLAGAISSISTITVPALLSTSTTNDTLVQLWKKIFDKGFQRAPTIALPAFLVHSGVAFAKWRRGQDPTPSVLAAVLTIGIIPFTGLVMSSTNNRLISAASSGKKQEDARTLINTWMWMNGVRALLPLVGGILKLIEIAN